MSPHKTPEEHPWAFDLPFVFLAWLVIVYVFCGGCAPPGGDPVETTWVIDEPSPDPPRVVGRGVAVVLEGGSVRVLPVYVTRTPGETP